MKAFLGGFLRCVLCNELCLTIEIQFFQIFSCRVKAFDLMQMLSNFKE